MRARRAVVALVAAATLLSACVASAPVIAVEVFEPTEDFSDAEPGSVLLVTVRSCRAGLQIETDENDERVRIAVRSRGSSGDCVTRFTLGLEEPLGDRAVIDAVTEQEIAVTR